VIRSARAFGTKARQIDIATHTDVIALDDASENSEGGLWLVIRYLVAGIINPREREVAILTDCSANVGIVHNNVRIPSLRKSRLVFWNETSNLERIVLSSIPIAYDISVTVDESDFDTTSKQIR
jgi:hypothetical protein